MKASVGLTVYNKLAAGVTYADSVDETLQQFLFVVPSGVQVPDICGGCLGLLHCLHLGHTSIRVQPTQVVRVHCQIAYTKTVQIKGF